MEVNSRVPGLLGMRREQMVWGGGRGTLLGKLGGLGERGTWSWWQGKKKNK